VIPTIVTQALSRETIELGATDTTRDFLYVGDTVAGMMRCGSANGVEGEVINLGTGVEVSIVEVVQRVLKLLQRDVPVSFDDDRLRPPDSEVERLVAHVAKAKALLGWAPETDLDEGLQLTIDWLTGSNDEYTTEIYNV
jgi:nucleoside-diphosphate-sugar epimerase